MNWTRKQYFYWDNEQKYIVTTFCRQLVETKKLSSSTNASTTSILHAMASSQVQGVIGFLLHKIEKSLGDEHKRFNLIRTKGLKVWQWGKMTPESTCSPKLPPKMLHNGPIYSPQRRWRVEFERFPLYGRPRIITVVTWQGKLDIFLILSTKPNVRRL